ncbi:MAG: BtrH N-terminal domain-containing protein [Bacteroidales bacterium]|nr:BtrH N-terminal domain-containing protein [Bacteroidales bacterium]
MNKIIDFKHGQAAHCENGVTSNLLNFYGIKLSEPMIFGIGSGLFFSYMPFIKMNGIPVTSFRPLPGVIFKRVTKRLGIEVNVQKFRNQSKSMLELNNLLEQGIPTGMVVGVYDLSYFPPAYRFRFNAHNIIGIGFKNNEYFISDPVMEDIEKLSPEDLLKNRFAKGTYKPKGKMYYIKNIPENYNIENAVKKAIKHTCKDMLTIPIPYFGLKGITTLANQVEKWPQKLGEKKAKLYLGQIVRMQEEIGTGGAGFRFMYAAFLQESGKLLNNPNLYESSEQMTLTGDRWRDFGVLAGRIFKQREKSENAYSEAANILRDIRIKEEKVFKDLQKIIKA